MRWLIRVFLSLAVLLVAMVAMLFVLPAEKVAGLASEQLKAATGREVTVTGRLTPSVWPHLGVSTGAVTLSNADWSNAGPMLRAEGLHVGLDLKALLKGEIAVGELMLDKPVILLEQASGGRANWIFPTTSGTAAASTGGSAPTEFTIAQAKVTGGTVIFADHTSGTRTEIKNLTAALSLPDYQGAAKLTAQATARGEAVTLTATLGRFGPFMAGKVAPVSAKLRAGKAKVNFKGRAGLEPLAADGQLEADLSDLGALFALIGQQPPALPQGMGKVIAAKGQAVYAAQGSFHLRKAALTLDGNTVNGGLDLYLDGQRPRLTGALSAKTLDLRPYMPASGGAAGPGWSTDPIDVSALGALDAEVAIAADKVLTGTTTLGRTRLLARLTDRRLVLDIRELRTHDGQVSGNFVVNGRGGLSVGGDLRVNSVSMQSLLAEAAGYDRLLAAGDLKLKFLGVGNSMDAIMKSLSGAGSFSLGKGELKGLDLLGMLTHLDPGFVGKGRSTIFEQVSANFVIKDGVVQNDDMAFLAPLLTAGGKGKVALGQQTLNYRVTPTAFLGGDQGDAFKVPLIITGTWAKPRFKLDLEALANQQLDLEKHKAALEAKAKAELAKAEAQARAEVEKAEKRARAEVRKAQDKAKAQVKQAQSDIEKAVKDEIGVVPLQGVDLGAEAQKALEKKGGKGLLKLLGGN